MITAPVWVVELAEYFWSIAGPPPPFPRDLNRAMTYATPLSLVTQENLTISKVVAYLTKTGLPVPNLGSDRPLRGALYCWRGSGFVFLDRTDPPDEQRFSLAHELSHFLRDADAIRRKVEKSLGIAAVEILDGRTATSDERIAACLRGITITPHMHLMSRNAGGRPSGDAESEAETRADQLAYELLAPASEFVSETNPAAVIARLMKTYGLPIANARSYSRLLLPDDRTTDPVIERILKFQ